MHDILLFHGGIHDILYMLWQLRCHVLFCRTTRWMIVLLFVFYLGNYEQLVTQNLNYMKSMNDYISFVIEIT